MKQKKSIAFVLLASCVLGACCHGPQKNGTDYKSVTVSQLIENPARYSNRNIAITGYLKNAGDNYFTGLRLILEDGKGGSITVRPWAPLEVPPSRPGPVKRERPRVMSDFLNRQLKLKGSWQEENGAYHLVVSEAAPEEKGEVQP